MKILSLHIYPIKGMSGISMEAALLRPEGFEHDRRWMLVDENGTFISQRSHPEMTLFQTDILDDQLMVSYHSEQIRIPIDQVTNDHLTVQVFDDVMQATVVSSECNTWFSKQLKQSLRLVKVSAMTNRIKDFEKYRPLRDSVSETLVSFADGYPYLILGSASMTHLNAKMESPLPIDRFRANIIIQTEQPHEEDEWEYLQIGAERLLVVKPCARCQVPTIDQKTGNRGKEPNKTLAGYRKFGNKVNFGMNAVALTNGILKVGDRID